MSRKLTFYLITLFIFLFNFGVKAASGEASAKGKKTLSPSAPAWVPSSNNVSPESAVTLTPRQPSHQGGGGGSKEEGSKISQKENKSPDLNYEVKEANPFRINPTIGYIIRKEETIRTDDTDLRRNRKILQLKNIAQLDEILNSELTDANLEWCKALLEQSLAEYKNFFPEIFSTEDEAKVAKSDDPSLSNNSIEIFQKSHYFNCLNKYLKCVFIPYVEKIIQIFYKARSSKKEGFCCKKEIEAILEHSKKIFLNKKLKHIEISKKTHEVLSNLAAIAYTNNDYDTYFSLEEIKKELIFSYLDAIIEGRRAIGRDIATKSLRPFALTFIGKIHASNSHGLKSMIALIIPQYDKLTKKIEIIFNKSLTSEIANKRESDSVYNFPDYFRDLLEEMNIQKIMLRLAINHEILSDCPTLTEKYSPLSLEQALSELEELLRKALKRYNPKETLKKASSVLSRGELFEYIAILRRGLPSEGPKRVEPVFEFEGTELTLDDLLKQETKKFHEEEESLPSRYAVSDSDPGFRVERKGRTKPSQHFEGRLARSPFFLFAYILMILDKPETDWSSEVVQKILNYILKHKQSLEPQIMSFYVYHKRLKAEQKESDDNIGVSMIESLLSQVDTKDGLDHSTTDFLSKASWGKLKPGPLFNYFRNTYHDLELLELIKAIYKDFSEKGIPEITKENAFLFL